jgi:hypothetical protein
MVDGLRRLGRRVDVIELDSSFPRPTPAALEDADRTFATIPAGTITIVDSLALGALAEIITREAARLPVVALVHLPPAAAFGLDRVDAEQFEAALRDPGSPMSEVIVYFAGYVVTAPGRDPSLMLDGERLGAFALPRLRRLLEETASRALVVIDAVPVAHDGAEPEAIAEAIGTALGRHGALSVLVNVSPAAAQAAGTSFTDLLLFCWDTALKSDASDAELSGLDVFELMRSEAEKAAMELAGKDAHVVTIVERVTRELELRIEHARFLLDAHDGDDAQFEHLVTAAIGAVDALYRAIGERVREPARERLDRVIVSLVGMRVARAAA